MLPNGSRGTAAAAAFIFWHQLQQSQLPKMPHLHVDNAHFEIYSAASNKRSRWVGGREALQRIRATRQIT